MDRHYRKRGFEPLTEPLFIQPQCSQKSFLLSPNDPTTRQICGGFAMASLWGGEFYLSTDTAWKVVQLFPRIAQEGDSAGGDVVVWYQMGREVDGTSKAAGICHYALLEISPFYRVPWDEVVVKRSGRRHADELPPDGSVPLRFQVVDAATYELLPGARVWMTFTGSEDMLIDKFVDADGSATAEQIPGSGGSYDVCASLDGDEIGIRKANISAGEKVNIIVPLKKKNGGDEAAKPRFLALQTELEDVSIVWSSALRRNDTANAQPLASRLEEINVELRKIWESNPRLENFFFETQLQSTDRLTRRIEKELGND